MVFWGDGWVGVEWGKSGKGGKVGMYLAYSTLNMIFFLWQDEWLDGDLPIDYAWVEEWNC